MKSAALICLLQLTAALWIKAAPAADAVNAFGLDVLRAAPKLGQTNEILSPYSLSSGLAVAMSGAAGATLAEFEQVLHLKGDAAGEFAALRSKLAKSLTFAGKRAADASSSGGRVDAPQVLIANRLYVRSGFAFHDAFLKQAADEWSSPVERLDFRRGPEAVINAWVSRQTGGAIRDLLPPQSLAADTAMVMANALYFKAPWDSEFTAALTKTKPFHSAAGQAVNVPFMFQACYFGYEKQDGFTAVAVPYFGGELQFTILLPDAAEGAADLLKRLTPEKLKALTKLPTEKEVRLRLPKLRVAPLSASIGLRLQRLGLRTAFDRPAGSADFSGIAPRTPDQYLALRECYHRTFLTLDERGTQAAAATVVDSEPFGRAESKEPPHVEVNVDHPFVFAIQHKDSGVCLFMGLIADPR